MARQSNLFRPSIEDRFRAFHAANHEVYFLLLQYALQAQRSGKRVGMKALWERLRWEVLIARSDHDYKLNNNFTAYYARMLEEKNQQLAGFFKKRSLRSA